MHFKIRTVLLVNILVEALTTLGYICANQKISIKIIFSLRGLYNLEYEIYTDCLSFMILIYISNLIFQSNSK